MFEVNREEIEWAGRKLVLETGKIARQADGAVLASYGETTVLATVVSAKTAKPGQDFFPLTVNYQEKAFAAGRIPGGYFKREGRPSEKETLVSRLIDRPIRPLFPEGYRFDTQVVVTVLSHDLENDPDILSLVAASAALTISGIPFMGPVGAARVGYIKNELKLNPTIDEMKDSALDLVVAGTGEAVLMVESEAKQLSEEMMLQAVMTGHAGFQPVIEAIIRLAEKAAREPRDFHPADTSEVEAAVLSTIEGDLRSAYAITAKAERYAAVDVAKKKMMAALAPADGEAKFSPRASWPRPSTPFRPRWCAGTFSITGPASTAAISRPSARSARKSVCCPALTVRHYSRAAKLKRSWWRRSVRAKTSSISTAWKAPIKSASFFTTTSLPIP